MERDITKLLSEWAFVPGQISVRLIEGQDHEPRIQVRLDLGLLQMYIDGRPDGQRPHDMDSYLDYYESQITSRPEPDPNETEGEPESFGLPEESASEPQRFLDPEDCRKLREEAQQYYHRYIALLVLEDFESVARDTSRNLRVLDMFRDYAIEQDDQNAMEGHRPYVMMMRARALASHAVKHEENKAAIHAIDEGIEALRIYYESTGQEDEFENAGEVDMLREMRDGLIPKLPVSQKAELKQRLEAAIVSENFELAAILRDELRMLGHNPQ
ncbi:MAG: UvrB/UvrC motif-containing protein [Phycisphaerales bacterium]|nr:UvrB/UvrC motif-containing protein [Phycisphaerales bacterium]